MTSATGEVAPRTRQKPEVRLQQHRNNIDVGGATLEYTRSRVRRTGRVARDCRLQQRLF
jgi:hypothetical protein